MDENPSFHIPFEYMARQIRASNECSSAIYHRNLSAYLSPNEALRPCSPCESFRRWNLSTQNGCGIEIKCLTMPDGCFEQNSQSNSTTHGIVESQSDALYVVGDEAHREQVRGRACDKV